MEHNAVILSRPDAARLRAIVAEQMRSATHDQDHLLDLREEIELATVVEPEKVPADVVTLESTVHVVDLETGDGHEYTLVPPAQANIGARRVSVTAPLGTALLGYREGDDVIWSMPGGVRRLRIQKVVQPQDPGPLVPEPPTRTPIAA